MLTPLNAGGGLFVGRAGFFVAPLYFAVVATSFAQEGPVLEEIMVTGSYIRSTSENEASPVEVLSNEYIVNSGAVDVGELTNKLAFSSGAENNADAFTAGETQGTSNINLRGLGLTSTLVLVNGKRQTIVAATANDGSVFVDTSTIPMAALERVEILKEGATATYGSDAVAGVANFILRKDVEGVEFSTGYEEIATSGSGKTDVNILAGFGNQHTRFTLAGTYISQDPMSSAEVPYTTQNALSSLGRSFLTFAPDTVSTGPYAGTYVPFETVADPACVANGGTPGTPFVGVDGFGPGTGGGGKCGFLYGPRFNLLNEEEKLQLYGNMTHDISDTTTLTAELGWTRHEVLDNPQSPSYPNLAFPTILPGQAGSPFNVPVRWYGRPLGSDAPSPLAPRKSETLRASLQLDGEFSSGWRYMGALTYSENDREVTQPDTIRSRLADALAGVGGPNGDQSFSPFDPTANAQDLIDYISWETFANKKTDLTVADFVVSGELFDTSQGPIGFAAGAQWRQESFAVSRDEIYTQTVDPVTGATVPADLIFLGGGLPVDESRESYALFAEANIPLTENLEASVAIRYEDLSTDSSVDPKLSLLYTPNDWLTLRASASSAFREPSLVQVYNQETSLQGLVDPLVGGSALFVQVNSRGNNQLKPETSTNFNFGVILTPTDNLSLRMDYWRFEYEDVITVENAQGKLNGDPNGEDILRTGGALNGVNVNYLNAASVDTDGIDVSADYMIPSSVGDFSFQLSATHFLSYEIPCTAANDRGCAGDTGVQDVVGYFNYDNFVRSMPETKVNFTADWRRDNHKLALLGFWTSSYESTRAVPAAIQAAGFSQNIDSWLTLDLQYAYTFNIGDSEAILTFGGKNITDEEAPAVYDAANFSYDAKHHDPRGQIWYGRIKLRF